MKMLKFNDIFKKTKTKKSKIEESVNEIIDFLKSNDITTWDDFIHSSKFDRFAIDKIIDGYAENKSELEDIKFYIQLELSNSKQLKSMIKTYQANEEYEKCQIILNHIQKLL